jgi:Asp-tRNA(Asn)/Glu-tRNA(Gln) amidotransferase A subunit family amidase
MRDKGHVSQSRRRFLQAVPVAVAGAVTSTAWAQQSTDTPGSVTTDTVRAAEAIDGLKFTGAEETAAIRGINNNLAAYQRVRDMKIPQDVEPAHIFKPWLPGTVQKTGPAVPGAPIRYTRQPATLIRPANLEDVAFWPVTKLAALLQRRLVSSVELTRMYVARLKRYQPALNFYVTLTEELALKQAVDADRTIAAGKYKGPLHGIPWGAKDLFATKGIKTTWGGEPYVDQIIDYDATIVERLHDAGAVLVAKLALGALAQGDRWFGGQTKNPWDGTQGSSGSSAGPGSATAAGCVGFAIGTETRGSILSPAMVNGCVGLRPTYGRVSRYGAMALSTTMDKVGPLCRYVEDAAVVLNVIYGPDGRDESVADVALGWRPEASTVGSGMVRRALWPLSNYKIAYILSSFSNPGGRGGGGRGAAAAAADDAAAASAAGTGGAAAAVRGAGAASATGAGAVPTGGRRGGRGDAPLTPEQQAAAEQQLEAAREAYADVRDVFTKLGAKVVPVDVPLELNQIAGALGLILNVEASASFDAATRSGEVDALATGTSRSSWPNTFREARFVPAVEYIQAMRARTVLQHRMDAFMQYDAILSAGDPLSSVANLTGHPAIAVKCAILGGHPRPLVLTGRLYDEATLCRIALAYEQATDWKDRHPSLAGLG